MKLTIDRTILITKALLISNDAFDLSADISRMMGVCKPSSVTLDSRFVNQRAKKYLPRSSNPPLRYLGSIIVRTKDSILPAT
jgi:hypothetical protein